MNISKRRVLVLAGGLSAILALALASVANGGGERLAVRGRAENAPSTTTSTTVPVTDGTASTGTTVALMPVTTGVPVPNATEAPPATAPPSATPAAPGSVATGSRLAGGGSPATGAAGSEVTADGAVMTRSASGATRAIDKAKGCNSAEGEGWTIEECGALRTMGTVLVWLVESKGKASRALVLKEQTLGRWAVVLSAADVNGTAFAKIGVRGEDVSGDGQPELVFGFHRKDAAATVAMDVVDATPATVVHRELARGSVVLAKGEITTWASAGGDAFDRVVIRPAAGAWRASAPERVARGAVPSSMI